MNDNMEPSNVETGVGAEDGASIVAAAMERLKSINNRIAELAGMHNSSSLSDLDPSVRAEVQELVEQLSDAEFGLEYAKARYVYGPAHYTVEVCDWCKALHWVPTPIHDDDDIKCTCRLCGERTRMSGTAHERMRVVQAAQSSEADLPFAKYWGDRLNLDSRSLLNLPEGDEETYFKIGDDSPG